MSLYIGNLSFRTRKDELEHVFRRFGRCTIQIKDGYGFAVYDFPPDAEKALKALQSRKICGEPLTLTWSNKQPRPFKRYARAGRSYKRFHTLSSSRGRDYANRNLGSNGQQDYKIDVKQPESNGGRLKYVDTVDDETGCHQDSIADNVVEESHEPREDLPDEGGGIEPNFKDTDRWGGQLNDPTNETALEFDRYEPYQVYDRKDEGENQQMTFSGHSSARGSSQEKTRMVPTDEITLMHSYDPKSQATCYTCGGLGHKMRNCPKGYAAERKFTRFDNRHSYDFSRQGRGEDDMERHGLRSRGERLSSREPIPMKRLRDNKKTFESGKRRRLMGNGSSPVAKEIDRDRWKSYEVKKQSSRKTESAKKHRAKKSSRSASSPLRSEYIATKSRSTSKSSKPLARCNPHLRSKSVSSRSPSLSSNSRSSSTSRHFKSSNSKSRSRSSSPTSLSLSPSPDRSLPSSRNKVPLNQQCSLNNSPAHQTEEIQVGGEQLVKGDEPVENATFENIMVAVNHEIAVSSSYVQAQMEKEQYLQVNNSETNEASKSLVQEEMDKEQCLQEYTETNATSKSLHEVANERSQKAQRNAYTAASSSMQTLGEMKWVQSPDAMLIENMPVLTRDPDSEAPPSSSSGHPLSISSDEMYRVLKHYDLELPKENERHLSVGTYFGSARLWPWNIVYYRRLKKGPISVENYARRIAENKEFGITDKYIRSSSGWGELKHENA